MEKEVASLVTEEAPEPQEELDLTSPEEGEPEEGDGKSKTIPYSRFQEVNNKRKAAEAKLQELEGANKYSKVVEKLYDGFADPVSQLEEDAQVASLLWEMREDPDVQKALTKINAKHNGRGVPKDPREAPKDPRIDQLIAQSVAAKTETILEEAKVRPELRSVLKNYVLENTSDPNQALSLIREYVRENGWTSDFLRSPGKRAPMPVTTGKAGGGPEKVKEEDKPKSLSELERRRREKLREAFQQ